MHTIKHYSSVRGNKLVVCRETQMTLKTHRIKKKHKNLTNIMKFYEVKRGYYFQNHPYFTRLFSNEKQTQLFLSGLQIIKSLLMKQTFCCSLPTFIIPPLLFLRSCLHSTFEIYYHHSITLHLYYGNANLLQKHRLKIYDI